MKLIRLLFCAAAFLLFVVTATLADDEKQEAKEEATKEWKNQTVCPVMGHKIDSSSYTDIQGQRVYHCCDMCTKKLTADPDKYFKDAAEAGILFENIQTKCPVSGMELKVKESFVDFEGRRVYFCCAGCEGPFLKNPQKYLAILDEPAKEAEKVEKAAGEEEAEEEVKAAGEEEAVEEAEEKEVDHSEHGH